MWMVDIPGRGLLKITDLVCDVNGTLAVDGELLPEVKTAIDQLRDLITIHMLTADTHGRQSAHARELGISSTILKPGREAEQKADFIRSLGSIHTAAIGQGANDAAMLKEAALGICVLSREGAAVDTLLSADVVVPDIQSAFDLFLKPLRLAATLRK